MKQMASSSAKKSFRLALLFLALCFVISISGYFVMMNTSIEKLPVAAIVFEIASIDEDDYEDMLTDLEISVYQMEQAMEYNSSYWAQMLSSKDMKRLENFVDAAADLSDKVTIMNLQKAMDAVLELRDTPFGDEIFSDFYEVDLELTKTIFDVLPISLLVAAITCLLFTIIGTLCRINGLAIFGAVNATIYCLAAYGILFAVMMLAAHILISVMLSQVNKEYKAYCAGTLVA